MVLEYKATDGLVAEIEKKITEAFEVFDRESNKTVDVREIGCIIRSLGCFPNEAEVQELLAQIEVEEPGGFVHLEKFLPVMTKVLLDRRFRPIPEDVILHAFEALDENKCGYITKEDLVKHLTEEGNDFCNICIYVKSITYVYGTLRSLPCRPKPAGVDTLSSNNAVAVMSGCRLGYFTGQRCRERPFICLLADIIK
uniref:EF-hand calcium binding domain 2 n=1 Tax=Cyanistes caeruleus TaxID=156563 RepID=A0A8C0U816_CYACU